MRIEKNQYHVAGWMLAIATVLAFAPDTWITMMARAFLLQWTVIFVLLAILAAWKRIWPIAASATTAILLVSAQLPQSTPRVPQRPDEGSLTVMHMNVLQPNDRHTAVIERALQSKADIITFQEVDDTWANRLEEGLRRHYPHQLIEPRSNCYGIAMFSRLPFERSRLLEVKGSPFIEATVRHQDRDLRILSVHATSPGSPDQFRRRNIQLATLSKYLREHPGPVVVIGDLNTVPWDDAFKHLISSARLKAVTADGRLRTWPVVGPLAAIPLDHLLHSHHLECTSILGSSIPGSDHRGLQAFISWKE